MGPRFDVLDGALKVWVFVVQVGGACYFVGSHP